MFFTIFCMSSKVIICGSRVFKDWYLFYLKVDPIIKAMGLNDLEIISGGAVGPDLFAIEYAAMYHLPCTKMPAQWSLYGRSAGFRRNADMMRYCLDTPNRHVIAFWDGKSRGTAHMIDIAKRNGFNVTVIPLVYREETTTWE